MASFKKLASGAIQIRVTHRLLPKPFWATFDDEKQARDYAGRLEGLLAQGIVPASLTQPVAQERKAWLITRCLAEYPLHSTCTESLYAKPQAASVR